MLEKGNEILMTWKILGFDGKDYYCLGYTGDCMIALKYYVKNGWKENQITFIKEKEKV